MTEQRGGGRLAGALSSRRIRRGGGEAADSGGGRGPQPLRRGGRARTGKSSNPRYKQALGYVRRDVHALVTERALTDPEVRSPLLAELDARGVEHKEGEADYGALVELLLLDWLESVGYSMER